MCIAKGSLVPSTNTTGLMSGRSLIAWVGVARVNGLVEGAIGETSPRIEKQNVSSKVHLSISSG